MDLSNGLPCESGSFSRCLNPHRFFQSEVLNCNFPSLEIPALESCVVRSFLLPNCSSRFICMQIWDCPLCQKLPCLVHQLQPCCDSSPPGFPSLPLLLVLMNVSSLTPWLSNFHTVQFSVSSDCFLVLNLLLSYFWLCEEAQCICLCLHLGQKYPT